MVGWCVNTLVFCQKPTVYRIAVKSNTTRIDVWPSFWQSRLVYSTPTFPAVNVSVSLPKHIHTSTHGIHICHFRRMHKYHLIALCRWFDAKWHLKQQNRWLNEVRNKQNDCNQQWATENVRETFAATKRATQILRGRRRKKNTMNPSIPLLMSTSLSLLSNNIKAFYELLVKYLNCVRVCTFHVHVDSALQQGTHRSLHCFEIRFS